MRQQAAVILAAASKKEIFSDLFDELIFQIEKVSPSLIPTGFNIPDQRGIQSLNESFLIIPNQNPDRIKNIQFCSFFISAHIRYHGTRLD